MYLYTHVSTKSNILNNCWNYNALELICGVDVDNNLGIDTFVALCSGQIMHVARYEWDAPIHALQMLMSGGCFVVSVFHLWSYHNFWIHVGICFYTLDAEWFRSKRQSSQTYRFYKRRQILTDNCIQVFEDHCAQSRFKNKPKLLQKWVHPFDGFFVCFDAHFRQLALYIISFVVTELCSAGLVVGTYAPEKGKSFSLSVYPFLCHLHWFLYHVPNAMHASRTTPRPSPSLLARKAKLAVNRRAAALWYHSP